MSSFELVVQKAIYDKLSADLAVPVYDSVPQSIDSGKKSDFPYISIGEDIHNTVDTDTELMNLVSITIHVWSRKEGRAETKQIQSEIYNSLHRANLVQAGYKFITITQENSTSFFDPDGHTRHGVQTFKLIIEEL